MFTADVETELNAQIDKDIAQDAALASISAGTVSFTPTGDIAATTVQAAIVEVDTEMHAADTALQAAITAGDALKVAKAGDTMTGHLTLPTGPAAANAVRKDYVDAADTALGSSITAGDALKVAKAGDTMTGQLKVYNGIQGEFIRHNNGTYGVIQYSDSGTYYNPLLTNSGDPNGTWNALRPFMVTLANGNVTMSHAVSIGGSLSVTGFSTLGTGWDTTCLNATLNTGGSGNVRIMGSQDAFLSLHRLSGFATNFGLANDNNLRWGGWSHGGNYWLLWSERHCGYPFSQGRILFAGDVDWSSGGMTEAAGTVVTGLQWGVLLYRCRYVQMYTNGWVTMNHA